MHGGPGSQLSKQLSCLPPSPCPPPLFQAVAPLLGVMSAPPRPPQEHCGQIWRTQQHLGAGTDWGGGAAPGWDRWQLVRGRGARGWPQGQSRREGPPSVPSAGSQALARPTVWEHSRGQTHQHRGAQVAPTPRSHAQEHMRAGVFCGRLGGAHTEHVYLQAEACPWVGNCTRLGTALGSRLPARSGGGQPQGSRLAALVFPELLLWNEDRDSCVPTLLS